jgi:hypothetical protein
MSSHISASHVLHAVQALGWQRGDALLGGEASDLILGKGLATNWAVVELAGGAHLRRTRLPSLGPWLGA